MSTKEPKSKVQMFIVCWLLGTLGIHRMMMGYKNWWVQLLTGGGCLIWSTIDMWRIILGKMPMADGTPLK